MRKIYNTAGEFGSFGILDTRASLAPRAQMISSYFGETAELMHPYCSDEPELEFKPQGTWSERICAGGSGITGSHIKTGVDAAIAQGKDDKDIPRGPDGEIHTGTMRRGIFAELSRVKAWTADASHLPGIYMRRLIQDTHQKRSEQPTARRKEPA